jgi:UDP-N-acetylmuramate dehydrogenase
MAGLDPTPRMREPVTARPDWLRGLRGELAFGAPMHRHCTWRAGGPAEVLFEPADRQDLLALLRAAPRELPITWIGLGSNILVRDGGVRGVVVLTAGGLGTVQAEPGRVRADAGVPCAKVARVAAASGLGGVEFLIGIPGSIGGALAMNAGAFGGEIWQLVEQIETVDRAGICRTRRREEYIIGYRSVSGPAGEWFLGCTLVLPLAGDGDPLVRGRALLAQRAATQPTGAASCGSVFRNPPGDHAGRLIDAAGLKGFRIGGCQVSTKHANFIINDGNASAHDMEALILHLRDVVAMRFGVQLEPEVRIIGESSPI